MGTRLIQRILRFVKLGTFYLGRAVCSEAVLFCAFCVACGLVFFTTEHTECTECFGGEDGGF